MQVGTLQSTHLSRFLRPTAREAGEEWGAGSPAVLCLDPGNHRATCPAVISCTCVFRMLSRSPACLSISEAASEAQRRRFLRNSNSHQHFFWTVLWCTSLPNPEVRGMLYGDVRGCPEVSDLVVSFLHMARGKGYVHTFLHGYCPCIIKEAKIK